MNSNDSNLIDITTGVEKRPEEISPTPSATEQMMKTQRQSAINDLQGIVIHSMPNSTVPAIGSSPALNSPPASIAKDSTKQKEWDTNNKMALRYITSTISKQMLHHVGKDKTAHQVYESLRKACEEEIPLTPCLKSIRWASYRYQVGQSPTEFLGQWRSYLAEMRDVYPVNQQVSPLFCCHSFVGAVSNNPECIPWINSLSLDFKDCHESDLNRLFKDFLAYESRRSRLGSEPHGGRIPRNSSFSFASQGKQSRTLNAHGSIYKKEADLWCAIHKRKGHATNDCLSNPSNPFRRKVKTSTTQPQSQPRTPATGQQKKPVVPNNEKTLHKYLSDED